MNMIGALTLIGFTLNTLIASVGANDYVHPGLSHSYYGYGNRFHRRLVRHNHQKVRHVKEKHRRDINHMTR